jgi:hypothetical protein
VSRLVWIELVALLAAAFVPLPVPRVVPVFAVASAARWARGKSWAQLFGAPPGHAGAGFAIGTVALVLALVAGTPLVEAITAQAVQWSEFPIVRGAIPQLFALALLVAAGSAALELALRGWVVERVLELGRPGPTTAVLAVAAGGLAEACVTDGGVAVRAGAALFGVGLGIIYVGAGRRLTAPLCARLGFALGALLLQGARLIG